MSTSMHAQSVPVFRRALRNLAHVLRTGADHVRARGDDPDALLALRLAPDMHPLVRQVQIATDMARNGASRLAGAALVPVADEETTMDALLARIDHVDGLLRAHAPEAFEDAAGRSVEITTPLTGPLTFRGADYLSGFVLPNLYFHCTIVYALLRAHGVPLGKADFMGAPRPA